MIDNNVIAAFETDVEEEVLEDIEKELDDILGHHAQLVVYNDDENTFEWVIECFVEILGHSLVQSEQLAYIIHHKGKATVKQAPKEVLKPLKSGLSDRGLSVVIEESEK